MIIRRGGASAAGTDADDTAGVTSVIGDAGIAVAAGAAPNGITGVANGAKVLGCVARGAGDAGIAGGIIGLAIGVGSAGAAGGTGGANMGRVGAANGGRAGVVPAPTGRDGITGFALTGENGRGVIPLGAAGIGGGTAGTSGRATGVTTGGAGGVNAGVTTAALGSGSGGGTGASTGIGAGSGSGSGSNSCAGGSGAASAADSNIGAGTIATGGGINATLGRAIASAASPNSGAETAMTPPHTEQRARTPPIGTLAGSTRNTDRQSGQVTFTAPPRRLSHWIRHPADVHHQLCLRDGRSCRPNLPAFLHNSSFQSPAH